MPKIVGSKDEVDALAARQATLETILMATLGILGELSGDPPATISAIMHRAERQLQAAAQQATGKTRNRAKLALDHFARLSEALLAHIARRAPTSGNA